MRSEIEIKVIRGKIISHIIDKQKNEGREKQNDSQYNADPQAKIAKKNSRSAILYLVADFLHNVIDGIGIGVAFTVSKLIGNNACLLV